MRFSRGTVTFYISCSASLLYSIESLRFDAAIFYFSVFSNSFRNAFIALSSCLLLVLPAIFAPIALIMLPTLLRFPFTDGLGDTWINLCDFCIYGSRGGDFSTFSFPSNSFTLRFSLSTIDSIWR